MSSIIKISAKSQRLTTNTSGYRNWLIETKEVSIIPSHSAVLLCDIWDKHWCRGAFERVSNLISRIISTVNIARALGILIVHAPSGTMKYYDNHPARKRVSSVQKECDLIEKYIESPIHPLESTDSSDTVRDFAIDGTSCWTQQHPAIKIDNDIDVISDNGLELIKFFKHKKIDTILIGGFHTNKCILDRSFGIKQLVRWGLSVYLLRDLTDCMYNPAQAPYVSHAEGLQLSINYIEQFWCQSILGRDLINRKHQ